MAEIFRQIDTRFNSSAKPVTPGTLNLHRTDAIVERFRPSALRSCGLPEAAVLYGYGLKRKSNGSNDTTGGSSGKMTPEELERRKHQRRRTIRNGSYQIEKGGKTKDRNRHRKT